jgi:uncharacterized membrane protein
MIVFAGSHVVLASHAVRTRIIGAVGANAFRGLYSLIALAALVWAAFAFSAAPYVELFAPGLGMKHLSLTVMVPVCILVATGYNRRNPTMFFATGHDRGNVSGIIAVTRHPLMWAAGLWALVHLAANGDAASWLFFGGFGALAFGGAALQDRKNKIELGAQWATLEAHTSYVPFAAMIAGRAKTTMAEIGWIRIAAGIVLYFVVLYGHGPAIGVSPLPF